MATASVDMITKLATDADAVNGALTKMQAQIKSDGLSKSAPLVTDIRGKFDRVYPQFKKFARDAARSPKILVEEDVYKKARKILTNMIKVTQKVGRVVAKEAADVKNEITLEVVGPAESEIVVQDKKLIQALKMVARGDKGRSGTIERGVPENCHIHVGGNAKYNLLFQPGKKLILGTINFHIESSNSDSQKKKVIKVAKRSGGKFTIAIRGDEIVKK